MKPPTVERYPRWGRSAIAIAAAGSAIACGTDSPPVADGLRAIDVPGLAAAWEVTTGGPARDVELFGGELFVASGTSVPELWRVTLGAAPTLTPVALDVTPAGRPRQLESNARFLYLSGDWGPDVYALRPQGTAFGAPRRIRGRRDFVPWITGEFLVVGGPGRPVMLLMASVPLRGGEYRRGWGMLPQIEGATIARGESEPWASVSFDSDRFDNVHALVEAAGAVVQYDRFGEPTLVRILPDDMRRVAARSAVRGYGAPLASPYNGLEVSCEGHLWISAGRRRQRVAVLDPRTYRVVRRLEFDVPGLTDALWSSCAGWVIGMSAETGRVVIGRTAGIHPTEGDR